MREKFRHIDLFSGIGGFSLSARWVWGTEHEPVAFVEKDLFCQKVLAQHWPGVPIYDDVHTFSGLGRGPIDLVTGGAPCQPFSVAGQQRGVDDERHLWPEMARVIRECQPRFVLFENVPGIRASAADLVLSDLEETGYTARAYVVGAWAVGAPHRRNRVWIVAHSRSSTIEAGAERSGRETRADFSGRCAGSKLADTEGDIRRTSGDDLGDAFNRPGFSELGDTANIGHERAGSSRNGCDGFENSSSCGMADSECGRREQPERDDAFGQSFPETERKESALRFGQGSRSGMADSNSQRERDADQLRRLEWEGRAGTSDVGGSGVELVNANSSGRRELRGSESVQPEQPTFERAGFRWPARPGERQFEWEAPRVVADAKRRERGGGLFEPERESEGRTIAGRSGETGSDGTAQPGLGFATLRISGRVARYRVAKLKALGNAIAPECAYFFMRAIRDLDSTMGE